MHSSGGYASKATIIHADGSDRYVLDSSASFPETDAVVTLTDIMKKISSSPCTPTFWVRGQGDHKINRTAEFTEVLKTKGIDCVVRVPRICAANDIVCATYGPWKTAREKRFSRFTRPARGPGAALEFRASLRFPQLEQKRLSQLTLKPHILFGLYQQEHFYSQGQRHH